RLWHTSIQAPTAITQRAKKIPRSIGLFLVCVGIAIIRIACVDGLRLLRSDVSGRFLFGVDHKPAVWKLYFGYVELGHKFLNLPEQLRCPQSACARRFFRRTQRSEEIAKLLWQFRRLPRIFDQLALYQ